MTGMLEADLESTRLTRRDRRAVAPLAYRRRNAELTLIIMAGGYHRRRLHTRLTRVER